MSKQEFLIQLRKNLYGLPQNDIEERLTFYSEIIDDRIEEGLSEEEATSAVGSIDKIVTQILSDTSLAKLAKERIKPKRSLRAWEIVLLALGSPIWLSLGVAAFAVILSVYVSLWSVIISLWAVFVSFIACSLGLIATGIARLAIDNELIGRALIGGGVLFAGLSIFMFFGCKASTKGIVLLTKKIVLLIKKCFIKKEEA